MTTTLDRELRYLTVPAEWTDTVTTRPNLVREVHRVHGPGWEVEAVVPDPAGGPQLVVLAHPDNVDPRPLAHVETISQDTPASKVPAFEARHDLAGLTTAVWAPEHRQCVAAVVPGANRTIRDALARLLKINRVELEITTAWAPGPDGRGRLERVTAHRAPIVGATAEKRRDAWVDAMSTLLPLPSGDQWTVRESPLDGKVTIQRRVDPLRALLFAGDLVVNPPTPSVVLGRSERAPDEAADLILDLARDATHIAVQGQTRSGKSVFAYAMLTQLAACDSVIIAGADPSGILLAPFVGTRHEPWQALGTRNPERVLEVLGRAVDEMDRRTALLGEMVKDKLTAFTPDLPLLVVVLEEYPGLRRAIEATDQASGGGSGSKLLPLVDLAIARLLAEGAKVGVRVFLMAQRLGVDVLKGGDRSNIPTRISFRMDKAEAVGMLHESIPGGLDVEEVRNFPPGVGLVESAIAGVPVTRFRAPLLRGDYAEYVRRIRMGSPVLAEVATPVAPEVIELAELEVSLDDLLELEEPLDLGFVLPED